MYTLCDQTLHFKYFPNHYRSNGADNRQTTDTTKVRQTFPAVITQIALTHRTERLSSPSSAHPGYGTRTTWTDPAT